MKRTATCLALFPLSLLLIGSLSSLAWTAERVPGRSSDYYYDKPGEDSGYSIRQTPDDGYLVAGTTAATDGDRDMAVWKFNADLQLDSNFADQGLLRLGSSGEDQAIDAIPLLDADAELMGYVVLGHSGRADRDFAGELHHGNTDTVILRLDTSGQPDPAWHNNGILFWGGEDDDNPISDQLDYPASGGRLLQLGDSVIFISHSRSVGGDLHGIGIVGDSAGQDAVLVKLNSKGEPDRSFAHRGVFRFGTLAADAGQGNGADDFISSLVELHDGSLLAVGHTYGSSFEQDDVYLETARTEHSHANPMLLRLSATGRLLDDWGNHGLRFLANTLPDQAPLTFHVSEDNDRRLLLSGHSLLPGPSSGSGESATSAAMRLTRLLEDGSADERFADNGVFTLPAAMGSFLQAVTLRDYSIAALGYSRAQQAPFALPGETELGGQGILALFTETGELHYLFSLGEQGDDRPSSMLLDRAGNVLVTGFRVADNSREGSDTESESESDRSQRQLWVSRLELGF